MIKADRTTCGIANKGFGGLRSSEIRFSFCNGRQERSPQSLTSHTTGTLGTILAKTMLMKTTTKLLLMILEIGVLCCCEKDNDNIPLVEKRYLIQMTSDYKILEVSFFKSDTLESINRYSYLGDKIQMIKTDRDGKPLLKSVYYVENHLADSCIDSVYYDADLKYVTSNQYTYNSEGYKTNTIITTKNFTNESDYYLTGVTLNYNYTNGNNTSIDINYDCSYYYSFTSQENKLNISTFIGEYCGKIDKNLRKTFNSGCHGAPSTAPESSEYSYILGENGLVTERTEIYSSSYHVPDQEPKKKKIITKFEYIILE